MLKNGKKDGIMKQYNEDGTLKSKTVWKDNKEVKEKESIEENF